MGVKYYLLWYRLKAKDRYLTWTWREETGETLLVINAASFIPSFGSPAVLREYAKRNNFNLESEKPRLHDLDWVASWIGRPRRRFDCKKALVVWNLYIDVAASIGDRGSAFKQLDKTPPAIYQKSSGETICRLRRQKTSASFPNGRPMKFVRCRTC